MSETEMPQAACEIDDCRVVVRAATWYQAQRWLAAHIRQDHPEGGEEDWLVDENGDRVDDDGIPIVG